MSSIMHFQEAIQDSNRYLSVSFSNPLHGQHAILNMQTKAVRFPRQAENLLAFEEDAASCSPKIIHT